MSWLKSTCTKADIFAFRDAVIRKKDGSSCSEIRKTVRMTEEGKLLFLANVGENDVNGVTLTLDPTYVTELGGIAELDLMTLEEKPVCGRRTGEGFEIVLSFEGGESHVLICSDMPFAEETPPKSAIPAIPIPERMTLCEIPRNMLTLDVAEFGFDGITFEKSLPVMGIKDNLLRMRYNGDVWLRFTYEVTAEYLEKAQRDSLHLGHLKGEEKDRALQEYYGYTGGSKGIYF
jgi:hypothetical protein